MNYRMKIRNLQYGPRSEKSDKYAVSCLYYMTFTILFLFFWHKEEVIKSLSDKTYPSRPPSSALNFPLDWSTLHSTVNQKVNQQSPHIRESKTVLGSGFHSVESGFQVLDSSI